MSAIANSGVWAGRGAAMTRVGGRWRVTPPWPARLRPVVHSYAGYREPPQVPHEAV